MVYTQRCSTTHITFVAIQLHSVLGPISRTRQKCQEAFQVREIRTTYEFQSLTLQNIVFFP